MKRKDSVITIALTLHDILVNKIFKNITKRYNTIAHTMNITYFFSSAVLDYFLAAA